MLKPLSEAPYPIDRAIERITVLPTRRKDGAGIYPHGTDQLVKQLRAAGVDSEYLDPPDRRRWTELLGGDPVPDLLFAIGTSLAASAIWHAFVAALSHQFGRDRQARIRLVRQSKDADGSLQNEWFEYEGPIDGLADAANSMGLDDER